MGLEKLKVSTHSGVIYTRGHPVVCEEHKMLSFSEGRVEKITTETGMVTERGLICPLCYKPARFATDEEAAQFYSMVGPQP